MLCIWFRVSDHVNSKTRRLDRTRVKEGRRGRAVMTNDPVIALGKVEKDFVTNVTSSFVFDFSSFLLGGLRDAEKSFTLSVSYLSHCSCNKNHFVLTCKRLYSCGRTYCNSDFPPFKTNAFGICSTSTRSVTWLHLHRYSFLFIWYMAFMKFWFTSCWVNVCDHFDIFALGKLYNCTIWQETWTCTVYGTNKLSNLENYLRTT